ncbi:DUF4349 domain-containing protein [Ammoniphilus resinae]|nr:DUF4349 domain-containing protein [Ammoniphilus resinae]
MKKWISCVLLLMLLVGCGNRYDAASEQKASMESSADSSANSAVSAGYSAVQNQAEKSAAVERKIIKEAEIRQKVTELQPAMQQVQKLVDQSGGYIESSSVVELDSSTKEAHYRLRIPQEHFVSILDVLQKIGNNTFISQRGEDLTEHYYDNEARIKNLTLQEQAVQKLLEKATKMDDILKIQQELFRIRGEIETLQGKNRYIDNLSSMATIDLTIQEVTLAEMKDKSIWNRATGGFSDSLHDVVDVTIELFVLAISILPLLIFLLPFGLIIWWVRRKRKKKDINA